MSERWFVYKEWGRTDKANSSFQFIEYDTEAGAVEMYAKELSDRNVKRGEWVEQDGKRLLRPKPGQDCYLVRVLAHSRIGLPGAEQVRLQYGARQQNQTPKIDRDERTSELVDVLNEAAISYAETHLVCDWVSKARQCIPSKDAIEKARGLLDSVETRLDVIGDDHQAQHLDTDLKHLTDALYSLIPKPKPDLSGNSEWTLSRDDLGPWHTDLNVFESALYAVQSEDLHFDPLGGLEMKWIAPDSELGQFVYQWWPQATAGREPGMGYMTIHNLWLIAHGDDDLLFDQIQSEIVQQLPEMTAQPLHQPQDRKDLESSQAKRDQQTNTTLLFHRTRPINVLWILRNSLMLPKHNMSQKDGAPDHFNTASPEPYMIGR